MPDFKELVGLLRGDRKWCDTNLLPVHIDIRTLAAKKQSRPGSQFPGCCMDNADRFADKWVFEKLLNPQTFANAGG